MLQALELVEDNIRADYIPKRTTAWGEPTSEQRKIVKRKEQHGETVLHWLSPSTLYPPCTANREVKEWS